MEQLVFEAIKTALSSDKSKWHCGIGIFDNMIEENEDMQEIDEKNPRGFRLSKVHAVFHFLRECKIIDFKKINGHTYYKWTNKLEELK